MAEITVEQAWDAVDYTRNEQDSAQSSATFIFIARGSKNEDEIIAAVRDFAPEILDEKYEKLPRQSIAISERLTEDDWKVSVVYADSGKDGQYEDSEKQEPQYNFEISAGTKKMVYAIKHVKTYPSSAPAPKAGINDGEGVEIIYPVSRFSETHFMTKAKVSASYKRKVAELVGKINNASFKGYSKGQVLFMGCTGSRTGREKWQITFNFAVSTKQTGISIGDISGISKDPWDVIWCQYEEGENNDHTETIKKVKAVHVEQVYEEGSFGVLGIGNN